MTAHVQKTEQADSDMLGIADYITQQCGSQHIGESFIDRLNDCLETLATQPLLGPCRDDLLTGLRYHPFERYLVFYTPIDNGIEVIRVIHAARDLEAIFH